MLTTANYNLQKPEPSIDNVDITVINGNMDIVDLQMKKYANSTIYETAGGTATAITLSNVTLENGCSKTFIASANNSGATTTINGKPLYKPGTTTAPTLIAGKAYTVWYNVSSTCFFIKASATGTATSAQVLAGVPFSNETDTDLVGTMPTIGFGWISSYCYKYGDGSIGVQIPTDGYYLSGEEGSIGKVTVAQLQTAESNLVSSNIPVNKSMFGINGSFPGYYQSGTMPYVASGTVTGLGFTPKVISLQCGATCISINGGHYSEDGSAWSGSYAKIWATPNTNGFDFNVGNNSAPPSTITWKAWG